MTLKDVRVESFKRMLMKMKTAVAEVHQEHKYLLESEKIYSDIEGFYA